MGLFHVLGQGASVMTLDPRWKGADESEDGPLPSKSVLKPTSAPVLRDITFKTVALGSWQIPGCWPQIPSEEITRCSCKFPPSFNEKRDFPSSPQNSGAALLDGCSKDGHMPLSGELIPKGG